MRWILSLLLFITCLKAEPLPVNVSAQFAILMNAESGAILYEKQARERCFPASLTKMATGLYVALEKEESLDTLIACPQYCLQKMTKDLKVAHSYKDPAYFLEPDGTHYWLKEGEKLPLRDLLYGLMLASGNDAANTLAHHIGGSIPQFMEGLNSYLEKIGCRDTHFVNPHGLHHPDHWTTVYDLALIARECLKNPLMRTIVSTREHERVQTNLQAPKKVLNRDSLIQPGKFFYPRALGMKTGYHSDAGYTYACVARDGKRSLIAILLGHNDPLQRFRDAIHLFEAAFDEKLEERLLFNKEENSFTRKIQGGKEALIGVL